MTQKLIFLLPLLFFMHANSQQPKWVLDKENLLTAAEINRIDSALQRYHESTGKFIIVCTDTADITAQEYTDPIYSSYKEIIANQSYVYILMLSRKNQEVISNVSSKVAPYTDREKLIKLMEPGFPLLKEQKREEAIMVICNNAVKFLDSLPKQ
jgi:uncharacterized membrane protein YgcG